MCHLFLWLQTLQIRRSQHAVINPAITIFLRMGAGGFGVPPLGCPDGKIFITYEWFLNQWTPASLFFSWSTIHKTLIQVISTKGLHYQKEEQKNTGPTGPNGCVKSENNRETELLLWIGLGRSHRNLMGDLSFSRLIFYKHSFIYSFGGGLTYQRCTYVCELRC